MLSYVRPHLFASVATSCGALSVWTSAVPVNTVLLPVLPPSSALVPSG
jgi:hypothetical protein